MKLAKGRSEVEQSQVNSNPALLTDPSVTCSIVILPPEERIVDGRLVPVKLPRGVLAVEGPS